MLRYGGLCGAVAGKLKPQMNADGNKWERAPHPTLSQWERAQFLPKMETNFQPRMNTDGHGWEPAPHPTLSQWERAAAAQIFGAGFASRSGVPARDGNQFSTTDENRILNHR